MKGIRSVAIFVLTLAVVPLTYGAPGTGDIHGVVRDSEGAPVAGFTIGPSNAFSRATISKLSVAYRAA